MGFKFSHAHDKVHWVTLAILSLSQPHDHHRAAVQIKGTSGQNCVLRELLEGRGGLKKNEVLTIIIVTKAHY